VHNAIGHFCWVGKTRALLGSSLGCLVGVGGRSQGLLSCTAKGTVRECCHTRRLEEVKQGVGWERRPQFAWSLCPSIAVVPPGAKGYCRVTSHDCAVRRLEGEQVFSGRPQSQAATGISPALVCVGLVPGQYLYRGGSRHDSRLFYFFRVTRLDTELIALHRSLRLRSLSTTAYAAW